MTDLQTLLKIKSDAIEEENKLAESLYKTSVDRIKVLEKQVEILTNKLSSADGSFCFGRDCVTGRDCTKCWQDWSLKEAEKVVKDE